jgi:amino acid adenylation domain-containing protein/non-ribosomal peptide synthase protein (TIGR01720 family)
MNNSFNRASAQTERIELLERLLKKKGIAIGGERGIPRRTAPGPVELSYGQERLWFLEQMDGAVAAYNNAMALSLKGRLNVIALEQSVGEVRRRHESLRTIFCAGERHPVQSVTHPDRLTAPVVEMRRLSRKEAEKTAHRLTSDEAYARFDLSRGPLMRIRLIRQGPSEYLLLLTVHHIASDGRSFGVLVREVVSLYEAFSNGEPSTLNELPIQYSDYAVWQRERLRGEVLKTQLSYWKQRLGDRVPTLNLPADHPRPANNSFRGARESFVLPAALTTELAMMSRRGKTTLFVVLLAAFNVLLSRYSGQDDITVGAPIANRDRADTEGLIGFFVNAIVLRGDLSGNPSFRQLVDRVSREALSAYAHQELPFELLVDHLKPERDAASTPLFQVCFVLQDQSQGTIRVRDFEATPVEISRKATKFDLTVEIIPVDGQLVAEFTYSTDQFDTPTIRRMGAHYLNVLKQAMALEDRPLHELSVLGQEEAHQLLVEWNDHSSGGSPGDFAHRLFEAQVLAGPDRLAIVREEQHLTYNAVNQKANQLAHYMRKAGLRPQGPVGICLGRSPEALIGMVASLKAGAAFLPLDQEVPPDRLAYILEDARAEFLLTTTRTGAGLNGATTSIVCLDSAGEALSRYSIENPVPFLDADTLAYEIYTSGSTGLPKAVQITHRGLSNLVRWHLDAFEVTSEDRATQIAGTAFDATVWEVWPYLAAGASLHVPEDEIRSSPSGLWSWLTSRAITISFLPTPLAECALSVGRPEELPPLRTLLTGGDRLHHPGNSSLPFRLVNNYGPTESSVVATSGTVPVSQLAGVLPPIGRPILNTQAYILGPGYQPMPIGACGQLYVAGTGLARGYSGLRGLTAERFVPNPFSNQPGARLYGTGDLARFRPDGGVDFLGRFDHQVKVRGFRIELGEIEATLGQHPELLEAAVVAQSMAKDSKRLVAFVAPRQAPGPDDESLRRFLQPKLPSYMIPSLFISIDQLPLTPNGKIDVESLSTLIESEPSVETGPGYVAPRTPVEKSLSAIWAEVLGIKQVGVHDNFFHLGGDSILSIQIVAKANQSGVRLRPQQIFQHQTIEALAREADIAVRETELEEEIVSGEVPLTPIQLWFFEQNLPNPSHFNQAVMVEARETLSPVALEQALKSLELHHPVLRHRFVETSSGWRQTCCEPVNQPLLTRIDLSALQGDLAIDAATKMLACELQASLDISTGRLIRVALFDAGLERASRLLIIIHHLVVDGVSWRILMDDLLTAYQQARRNEPIQLPMKTTSYKRWAERLKEHAQSAALRSSSEYWLRTPWERAAPLPRDYRDGANVESSIRVVTVQLSREDTRSLLQEVPAAFHTQINDVLITTLAQAFWAWTGERCLLLSLEGHGREEIVDRVDISRTVGWFTSIFPVLVQLDGVDTVESLMSIKEQLSRIPDRGVGFGLQRYLAEGAEAERIREVPRPELSFNYLGQFDQFLTDSSLFAATQEPVGPLHGSLGRRNLLIEVNANVLGGQLELRWSYSENIHRRITIQQLAQSHLDALVSLINRRAVCKAFSSAASDYPLAQLDEQTLGRLGAQGIEDIYELTAMQHGMLVHTRRAPDAGMYINQVSYELEGALNVAALKHAWQSVVGRHAIWRTGFAWDGLDEPLQIVHRRAELSWNESDWRCLSREKQQETLDLAQREDFSREFDLSRPPLMRLHLIRLNENTHQFIWSFHHLVMDGWSVPLVLSDVFRFYRAYSDGLCPKLAALGLYRDYVAWLRRQDRRQAEEFWRRHLKGFTTPTPLKLVGANRGASKGDDYCDDLFRFSGPATESLQRLGREQHLTVNTVLQGLWALLLSRYSGHREVMFGAVVSGRPAELSGVETIVGPFINTFPVRVELAPDTPILVLLGQLQDQQLEARVYQYNSLVEIQGWSDVARNQPLFESIIVFENYPIDRVLQSEYGGGVSISKTHGAIKNNYPITIRASLRPELSLNIMYDAGRFHSSSITRVFEHLEILGESLIEHPGATVQSLTSALAAADRDRESRAQEEFRETLHGRLKAARRKSVSGLRSRK